MLERKPVIGLTPYKNDEGEYVPKGYSRGIAHIECEELVISRATPLEQAEKIVEGLDALLIPGGVDVDPAMYGAEREPECGPADHALDALQTALFKAAMRRRMPILGICRGCQFINAAMGGTLIQDVPKKFGKIHQMPKDAPSAFDHDVRIVPGTMLFEIMGGDLSVDSYHHQCVDRLADGLVPSAYAPEGFIEAFEMPKDAGQFLMAVQWHPEVTLGNDMYSVRIFELFGKAIRDNLK